MKVICPGCGIKGSSWNFARRLFRGRNVCVRCRDLADTIEIKEADERYDKENRKRTERLKKVPRVS